MARLNRISQQFRPEQYDLKLSLNDDLSLIEGTLEIKGSRRSKPSYRITLHQSGIKVTSAKLFKLVPKSAKPNFELEVTRVVHHSKLEELRIHTKEKIDSGDYLIKLSYKAKPQLKTTSGVYISTWHVDADSMNSILTTQFQPHYARTLLPCIDEPEAKALFNLSLRTPLNFDSNFKCLFNTEVKSVEDNEDKSKTIIFEQTPKMSTYLLALIVGKLESVSSKTSSQIPVSIYSTPNKLDQTKFALYYSIKVFDLLEEYFSTKFPLNKCDLVAIPDFDSGGMENWGLITFREDLLLFDEELSTLADKQAIALTIAHEISHQWFGNLVTIKWWDELWLNEGFANFMEYFIVDKLNPEWNILEDYLVTEKTTAIRLDSLPSSRPIITKVTSPHHALEVFDEIAYQKSGSLIRMIYSTIGEDAFKKGLTAYFNKFKFSSATSSDLIACWQNQTTIKIKDFISTWLSDPGLPILEVSTTKTPNQIQISQSRFLSEKNTKKQIQAEIESKLKQKPNIKKLQRKFYQNHLNNKYNQGSTQVWQIPIDFVTASSESTPESLQPFILKKQTRKAQLPANSQLPVKLNKNGQGFYITKYSVEFLAQISKAIEEDELSNLDILNILSDFIALDKLGQFEPGCSSILNIISRCKSSLNANFWGLVGSYIGYIHHQLKQSGQEELVESYTRDLISPALKKLSLDYQEDEATNITAARFEVISLAVMAKDPAVCKHLTDLFYANKNDLSNISPELRVLSLYAVAKLGKKQDFSQIHKMYEENHEDVSLREDLMYGLTSFEDQFFAQKNIELIQDSSLTRSHDILSWLSLILSSSKSSKDQLLDWLVKRNGWSWLEESLSPTSLSFSVRVFISATYSKRELNSLSKFFLGQDNEELLKPMVEAKEIATCRISWNKHQLPKVIEYLTSVESEANV